jgi:hypothetical protein
MGMHPKLKSENFHEFYNLIFGVNKSSSIQYLLDHGLIDNSHVANWKKHLSALEPSSPIWFELHDHFKMKIDAQITNGGHISSKSSLDIIKNYKYASQIFNSKIFSDDSNRGKIALDFGSGVYRPLGVAALLYINGFDHVYAYEPFPIKLDFAIISFNEILKNIIENPNDFNISSISNEELLIRAKSLFVSNLGGLLSDFHSNNIKKVRIGGISLISDIELIQDDQIDVHFSNAVLEHVSNMESNLNQLRRITTNTSIGFHIVDFLDHRYYDDPTISPLEKYYDGYLDEINGLTPSELENKFTHNNWKIRKITTQTVPGQILTNDNRPLISRYSSYSESELLEHINFYELNK